MLQRRFANQNWNNACFFLYTVEVYNVSISPSDNPLTIRESTHMEVHCVVNSNAVPAPNITWYLGSTDITYMAGTDTTSINITGNRTDNTKSLECRASNSNTPPKTANTKLNLECKLKKWTYLTSHKNVFKILQIHNNINLLIVINFIK